MYYAEIPVESSVLWMDSLGTGNHGYTGETTRLLAGHYTDPVFGSIQAHAFMQYKPSDFLTKIPVTAAFDSVVFQVRFDFYSYGSVGETTQTFDVFEITQELNLRDDYFFNSNVAVANSTLGTKSFNVNSEYFKTELENTKTDSVLTVKTKLSNAFGQRLFDAVNPEDVNYTDFELFKTSFKGLAIIPQQSDKIVGFRPADVNSTLTLYYHDGDVNYSLPFIFSQGITFSKIVADRSSTELSGLNQFHTDFDPGLKRYIQSGTSIITKLDFSKFYEYIDTIPNIIVNSAELEVADIETSSAFNSPTGLSVSMLRMNNRYKTYNPDSLDYFSFKGMLALQDQLKFFVVQDDGQPLTLNYSSTENVYSGFSTLFTQKLFDLKSKRHPFWALRPSSPQPGKSVDRVVFPKDKIKLKVYYTRPTLDKQ